MRTHPSKILNVASTAGVTPRPGWLAYASSKAAVVSMGETLTQELAEYGIKMYDCWARRATSCAASRLPRRTRPRSCSRRMWPIIATLVATQTCLDGQNLVVRQLPAHKMSLLEYDLSATWWLRAVYAILPAHHEGRLRLRARRASRGQPALHPRGPCRRGTRHARRAAARSATATAARQDRVPAAATGTYDLATACYFVVDNAYLPIHVIAHRRGTYRLRGAGMLGALERFVDMSAPNRVVETRSAQALRRRDRGARGRRSRAVRLGVADSREARPPDRRRAHGLLRREGDGRRTRACWSLKPQLRGKTVVLDALMFRGDGTAKAPHQGLDARLLRAPAPRGRGARPQDVPRSARPTSRAPATTTSSARSSTSTRSTVTDVLRRTTVVDLRDALMRKPLALLSTTSRPTPRTRLLRGFRARDGR